LPSTAQKRPGGANPPTGHQLKESFMTNDEFSELKTEVLKNVYAEIYGGKDKLLKLQGDWSKHGIYYRTIWLSICGAILNVIADAERTNLEDVLIELIESLVDKIPAIKIAKPGSATDKLTNINELKQLMEEKINSKGIH
jgi:hypothetical protein